MSQSVEAVAEADPPRAAPRIVCFEAADSYTAEYFCVIEKKPLFKVPTFSEALSIWFATHYVFDLMYSKQTKDVALFFQECVFGLPEPSKGRSATYLTVSSDINKFL
jgi:hypothetical protein